MSALAGHDAGYARAVWAVASVVGALVVCALVVALRRARARAELEAAEALIAAELGE